MKRAAAFAACVLLSGCATPSVLAPSPSIEGYLDNATLDALAQGFAPSDADGVWRPTVAEDPGPGTDRWWLATAHAELRPPEAAQHFDCALETRLTQTPRPALNRLMGRLLADADSLTRRLARSHPRARPVAVTPGLEPCQRINDAARSSPSWPAGGAVAGAVYGEMFADLAPDRASAVRRLGSAIGQSRVVCRMNWPGDARDGALIGQAIFSRAAATPDFAADLEAARVEISAARAEGLSNPSCAAERRALTVRPVAN